MTGNAVPERRIIMIKEYIEREAAKRELLSWAVCMNHPEYLMKDDALHVIDSIPAADVVEVVRCRECKHCDPENHHCDHHMGTAAPLRRKPDDYCSFGERREGAD